MKVLTPTDVTFTVTCEEEFEPVRGNAMASGDYAFDRETEDHILAELSKGNAWAWFCAKVTCEWLDMRENGYLGCCSYKSREDFEASDYCKDLKAETLANLNDRIFKLQTELAKLKDAEP